jgi:hypothetical protein
MDFKYFSSQLRKKLSLVQAKRERLEHLQKYLRTVCGLVDNPVGKLAGQL